MRRPAQQSGWAVQSPSSTLSRYGLSGASPRVWRLQNSCIEAGPVRLRCPGDRPGGSRHLDLLLQTAQKRPPLQHSLFVTFRDKLFHLVTTDFNCTLQISSKLRLTCRAIADWQARSHLDLRFLWRKIACAAPERKIAARSRERCEREERDVRGFGTIRAVRGIVPCRAHARRFAPVISAVPARSSRNRESIDPLLHCSALYAILADIQSVAFAMQPSSGSGGQPGMKVSYFQRCIAKPE